MRSNPLLSVGNTRIFICFIHLYRIKLCDSWIIIREWTSCLVCGWYFSYSCQLNFDVRDCPLASDRFDGRYAVDGSSIAFGHSQDTFTENC